MKKNLILTCCVAAACAFSLEAGAEQTIEPNVVISDGKGGTPFNELSRRVKEKPVKGVAAVLKRVSGGDDTFVNLRFGDDSTLDGGKRVYLKGNEPQRVVWNVGGERPNGRPLVMKAYNGAVRVKRVTIRYGE